MDHSEREATMSRLGNYSEPDCRTVRRTYGAETSVVLVDLGPQPYCQASWVLSSSELSSFRVYPRKSDPGYRAATG